jgi:RsiW-degrading membrane proteinase PrsW (M82 family)
LTVVFLHALLEGPALVAVAALAPAVAYAGLVVWLAPPREPLPLLVGLFLWGAAVAAVVSETANTALGTWATAVGSESAARALGPVLWAPLVEETAKGLGLVVLLLFGRERLRDVPSGIACGALVGLGFAAAENLEYHLLAAVQGGPAGLARAVFVRGIVEGLNHATFTAAVGAGLGFTRAARGGLAGISAVLLGFGGGVLQHAAWNGIASHAITDLLCGATVPGGECSAVSSAGALFLGVPILVATFLGPGIVGLVLLARAASRLTIDASSSLNR